MTSKLTKEWLQHQISAIEAVGITDSNTLAAFKLALAAMDSEPVAELVSIYGDHEAFGEREIRPLVGIQQMPHGTKLYRQAQPELEHYSMFDVVASILDGIDRTELEDGWWETSAGAESGREALEKIRAAMLNGGKS